MKRMNMQIPVVALALIFAGPLIAAGGIGGSGAPASRTPHMDQDRGREPKPQFEIEKARVKAAPEEDVKEEGDNTGDQEQPLESGQEKE